MGTPFVLVRCRARPGLFSGHHSRVFTRNVRSHLPRNVSDNPVKQLELKGLWKPFAFSCGVTVTSFTAATLWQYENRINHSRFNIFSNDFGKSKHDKRGSWRDELNRLWANQTEGQKLAIFIISTNVAVFLAWRIRFLSHIMKTYFVCQPLTKPICLPMVLAMFSHVNLIHLGCNMMVLWSFLPLVVPLCGHEQTLALYLSGGVFASFFSKLIKVLSHVSTPSVGASGAILTLIAVTCTIYPDLQLGILFVPFFSFPAHMALKTLMAVDTAGVVFKWKFFDHGAHLGGAIFGLFYYYYGQSIYLDQRRPLITRWHEFRKSSK